jgi:hypothetical protein
VNLPAKTTFHLFEKFWHLRVFEFVATLPMAGPFPARKTLSVFTPARFAAGCPDKRQGIR